MTLTAHTSDEPLALTAHLAETAAKFDLSELDAESLAVAKQCILDWVAVTLAGAAEPLSRILAVDAAEEGGHEQATILGHGRRGTEMQAALVNGSTSHALDYDDVNSALHGHPTVPVVPAVLAVAEHRWKSGRELLAAFVAGYETECRIGLLMTPSHYANGYHATATIGTFGAAAGVARLLGLDAADTAQALGMAATQAAGLKAVFGSMSKPLHAGKAAANGLLAARLAGHGFTSRPDILEAAQGFANTLSDDFNLDAALATPAGGFHVRNNLFKYHAACYLTHSPIEALAELRREHEIEPEAIEAVTLVVAPGHLTVCNIPSPATGLECKFSLRHTAAFALSGEDTGSLETFSDENAGRPDLVRLRERVQVETVDDSPRNAAGVRVALADGRVLEGSHDVGVPTSDVADQGARILAKYHVLVDPLLGREPAEALAADLDRLEEIDEVSRIMDQLAGVAV
ncbi:MAG: MmgE/PrpD family protein [Alphaproteobacteria bacterium]|jgi:2-methylcitrate dehydratase PrpD|nr:MmgE/PrpD family protein [Alphaproteobacteria bacterium]